MDNEMKDKIILCIIILSLCFMCSSCLIEYEKEITKRHLMDACVKSPSCKELPDGVL